MARSDRPGGNESDAAEGGRPAPSTAGLRRAEAASSAQVGLRCAQTASSAQAGLRRAQTASSAQAGGRRDAALTVLASLLAGALYVWHISPAVRYWDAAERALAALHLGLSHPPGCFLHAVVGKAFLIIGRWPAAYSANLLSALAAALAVGVAYQLARRFCADRSICFLATLVLATSALLWSQAIYSEVYALHLLMVAVFLLSYIDWLERGGTRRLAAAAFLFAVGLGVHLSHILWAPWILIGVLIKDRSVLRSPRALAAVAGALLLGLTWIAGVYVRGQDSWLLGTIERPDSPARLWAFLSGAQFAWARHPATPIFVKRVVGSVAILSYSFAGIGALVALWGWARSLRRHTALCILAAGGTVSYILFFSDSSTSDVATLILPCCLFIVVFMVIAATNLATTRQRRRLVRAGLGLLALSQAIVFPLLSHAAGNRARMAPDRRAQPLWVELFWEGVRKATVSFRGDYQPMLESGRLANFLDHSPGPKVLIVPWAVQTILEFYRATGGWFEDVRIYEHMVQRRFYPTAQGQADEVFSNWQEAVAHHIAHRPVFLLYTDRQIRTPFRHARIATFWFDNEPYYLFRLEASTEAAGRSPAIP